MESTKLRDFLKNLDTAKQEQANTACDDSYDEGFDAGFSAGRKQGLTDMYGLLKNLDQEQIATLKLFARHVYITGLENSK